MIFPDEIRYRWALARLQRDRQQTANSYKKKFEDLLKAKGGREAREDLRRDEQFELEEWDEEIDQLTTGHLREQARRLIVPLPSFEDEKAWFESKMFGFKMLTPEGVKMVRADLRAEQKARWEFWQTRVTLGLALLGSVFGVLAYFK
ncbi:hypothetical protein [Bradyrhizobium guangzhouense]|uniref:hypothetical protein n=1 Tax=Bradyrhizobium guangzhouense TaxID=1325095 RepID=UPI001009BD67|nr:hypothetical protein [Bradyrhizobium guangzhouense]RXH14858.1 hypothetical protein EAS54_21035 [Bradyrhizobium guangzhouense]